MRRVLGASILGAAAIAMQLLAQWTPATADLSLLGAASWTAGLMFGAVGIAVVAIADVSYSTLLQGTRWLDSLVYALARVVPALLAFVAFRAIPGVGRALPNLRSYLVFLPTAALGSSLGALYVGWILAPESFWPTAYLWAGRSFASYLLIVPPLSILIIEVFPAWITPWRGEVKSHRRLTERVTSHGAEAGDLSGGALLLLLLAVLVAITLFLVRLDMTIAPGQSWPRLLYLAPLLWASLHYGLQAGLLSGSLGALVFTVARGLRQLLEPNHADAWEVSHFADLLFYSLIAVTIGHFRERLEDSRLRELASERRYRDVVDSLTEYVVRWVPGGIRTFVNVAYCRAFGRTEEELLGTSFYPLISAEDRQSVVRRLEHLTVDSPVSTGEHRVSLQDGTTGWQSWTDRAFFDSEGELVELQSVGHDITARKRSEEELRASRQRLQALTVELQSAEERERRRMANYLHDEIGQALAVLRMKLAALEAQGASETSPELMAQIRALVEKTIARTRSLTLDLSPPVLYELGLEAAVEWIGRQICSEAGIDFSFEDDGLPRSLDERAVPLLYRGARELLMNTAKHARATGAKLSIGSRDGEARLTVEDDGRGFDTDELAPGAGRTGFGLYSLRERLQWLGGRLEFESRPGGGTRATMVMPIAE